MHKVGLTEAGCMVFKYVDLVLNIDNLTFVTKKATFWYLIVAEPANLLCDGWATEVGSFIPN